MRFALATGQENASWPTLCALWDAADAVDLWESAWIGDHFTPFLTDPTGPCLEGWVTLTALAQRTRRLRAGIFVSGMPHRHPAVLAKMAASTVHRPPAIRAAGGGVSRRRASRRRAWDRPGRG